MKFRLYLAILIATSASFVLAHDLRRALDPTGPVGENSWQTPANQLLRPAGVQVPLAGLRPQALALSGRVLVTSGQTAALLVLDAGDGKILQHVRLPGGAATNF